MNKIKVEENLVDKKIIISEDKTLFYKDCNLDIEYEINSDVKVFIFLENSKMNCTFNISDNLILNIFSVNSSLDIDLNLNKENIILDYAYNTMNIDSNNYKVNINHNKKNCVSKVVNHGINLENSNLCFTVNTVVGKDASKTKANQDSKIILIKDKGAQINPNLIIDNDDIEANHSSYIGDFKKEEMFYIKSRGLSLEQTRKLLAKSFLIGNMDLSYKEINIILLKLNQYWR